VYCWAHHNEAEYVLPSHQDTGKMIHCKYDSLSNAIIRANLGLFIRICQNCENIETAK